MTQLSLLGPPARSVTSRQAWYARIRPEIRERYRGQEITTDEVWELIAERPELRVPDGMSSNVMGALFSDWGCAVGQGFTRSKRPEAHSNLLRVWLIT